MLEVLDVIVADNDQCRGDFWRVQRWMEAHASRLRPKSYLELTVGNRREAAGFLQGKRLRGSPYVL